MNSQDVILGMLMERSLSGYEMKHLFEEFFTYFYNSSYGTIYPMLQRMEKEGLLTKENVPQEGKPNKNVYSITDAGRSQFEAYMRSPLESDSLKSDFLMRLFFGEFVGYDRISEWLKQAEEHVRSQLEELNGKYARYKAEMHPAQVVCIKIGIRDHEAKLEAIREGLGQMDQLMKEERGNRP